MTKSVAAFRMTAESLWQKGFRVYFWTFTFNALRHDWVTMQAFTKFLHHLDKVMGGDYGGVRVAELHKEHGVHFHALVNRRLNINIVRRVARCYGIGRIHVKVADQNRGACAGYLAKYLSKQVKGPISEKGNSCRRWASFGKVVRTRVRDIVNDSPMWRFRREHALTWLGYRFEFLLSRCWMFGEQAFKSAWYAGRSGREGDLLEIATGWLDVEGPCQLVRGREFRQQLAYGYQPF